MTKITVDDLREYISYLSEIRGLRDGSLLTHINTLRSFFSWLTVEGVIRRNPMLKIKSPRLDRTRSRHALSQEQLERLYRETPGNGGTWRAGCHGEDGA